MVLHTEVLLWVESTGQWYEFLADLTGHGIGSGPRGGGGGPASSSALSTAQPGLALRDQQSYLPAFIMR
jgi:hypothetical protein